MITSLTFRPAFAAGLPAVTSSIVVPPALFVDSASGELSLTPMYACWTVLPAMISLATFTSSLAGVAKPMPAF